MTINEEDTAALRIEQVQRAQAERRESRATSNPEDQAAHDRRAERAAYLAKRLAEREESEAKIRD